MAIFPLKTFERVHFYDVSNPQRNMPALFNPTELPEDTEVTIGELNPIGSSSTTLQYAHTKSSAYTISLAFSARAMIERGSPMVDLEEAKGFFKSFLYGEEHGKAPSAMQMIWPNFMSINYRVKRVNVMHTRWDMELKLREYMINLTLIEQRREFITSTQIANGQLNLPPDVIGSHRPQLAGRGTDTGRPFRVAGRLGSA